ncbi:hypothetical protein GCM10022388_09460 [Flavobacterium chungnamense]|uniref:Uncharacterized protein n=1 Tax=Flavobacterium chungnamense TaxID=706182 RepID=A0ABP7ULN7_9FLAO
MKKVYFILFIYLFIGNSILLSQNLTQIVKKISDINELQYNEKQFGEIYENWANFEELKKIANTDKFIELIENKNPIVKAYASFGLVDNNYSNIPSIYRKFIENDSIVETADGSCTAGPAKISHELYFYYLRKLKDEEICCDTVLFQIDSLTIYNKSLENFNIYDGNGFIISKVLTNRVFPNTFNKRIAYLAFEKNNDYAIDYLSNWHKAEFKKELIEVFLKKFKKLDYESNEFFDFFEITEQLLKFSNKDINNEIVEILKKNENWVKDKRQFINLFNKYGIYDFGF